MNIQEKAKLAQTIAASAYLYDRRLPTEAIEMMVEDLCDLPLDQVIAAFSQYRRTATYRSFPTVGQIREIVTPSTDDDSVARDSAAKIVAAVSKYGWNNATQAREFMGELAWSVVAQQGGWVNICETLTHDNIGIMQAQWRDLAKSTVRITKSNGQSIALVKDSEKQLQGSETKDLVRLQGLLASFGRS